MCVRADHQPSQRAKACPVLWRERRAARGGCRSPHAGLPRGRRGLGQDERRRRRTQQQQQQRNVGRTSSDHKWGQQHVCDRLVPTDALVVRIGLLLCFSLWHVHDPLLLLGRMTPDAPSPVTMTHLPPLPLPLPPSIQQPVQLSPVQQQQQQQQQQQTSPPQGVPAAPVSLTSSPRILPATSPHCSTGTATSAQPNQVYSIFNDSAPLLLDTILVCFSYPL